MFWSILELGPEGGGLGGPRELGPEGGSRKGPD